MTELQELLDACIRRKVSPRISTEDLERMKQYESELSPATRALLIRKLRQCLSVAEFLVALHKEDAEDEKGDIQRR